MFVGLFLGAVGAFAIARHFARRRWLRHAWAAGFPGYAFGPFSQRWDPYDADPAGFGPHEYGPHDWDPYDYAARRSSRGCGGWAGRGFSHGFRGRHGRFDRVIDLLDPTPEQRRVILRAMDEVRTQARSAAADLSGVRRELADAVRAEPLDESAFARASEQAQAAARSLGEPMGRALFEIHQALDPRQRRILADLIEKGR